MANESAKRLIAALVQKEVRRLLPEAVKQVLANIITESVVELNPPRATSNAHKRRAVMEEYDAYEAEEYDETPAPRPTRQRAPAPSVNRAAMIEAMGYGDMVRRPRDRQAPVEDEYVEDPYETPSVAPVMVLERLNEDGNPIPVRPGEISPALQKALSRDYTDIVKKFSQ